MVLFLGMGAGKVIVILLLGLVFFFGALGPDKTTETKPAMNYPPEIRGTGQRFSKTMGRIEGVFGVVIYRVLIPACPRIELTFLSITCFAGFAVSTPPLSPKETIPPKPLRFLRKIP